MRSLAKTVNRGKFAYILHIDTKSAFLLLYQTVGYSLRLRKLQHHDEYEKLVTV